MLHCWDELHVLGAAARHLTLASLGVTPMAAGELISCSPSDTAVVAFERMHHHKVSGLPILDRDGRLRGQVTAEGLGRLLPQSGQVAIDELGVPLEDFLPPGSLGDAAGSMLAVTADTSVLDLFIRCRPA